MNPDLIKQNVLKLQNANASPQDIEAYVKSAAQESQQSQSKLPQGKAPGFLQGIVDSTGLPTAAKALSGAVTGIAGLGKAGVQYLAGNKQGAAQTISSTQQSLNAQPQAPIFKTGGLISPQGSLQQPFNPQGVEKAVGSGLQLGATAASFGAGTPATLGGRVALDAGVGGLLSGGESVKNGESAGNILKNTALGSAVGGALPLAGKAIGSVKEAITKALPKSIVRAYIPAAKDVSQHVLDNTKLGFTKTMLSDATTNIKSLSGKISDILEKQYGNHFGQGSNAVQETLAKFPDSEYTIQSLTKTLKGLVPEKSKLVDDVINGVATLKQKDTLRSALDRSVESVYTKLSVAPARKEIGATFASALRNEVKGAAKETIPLYDELAKEINVKKALDKSTKKFGRVNLRDLMSVLTGATAGATHGVVPALVGATSAVVGERALSSPAVGVGVAKALYNTGKLALPSVVKNAARFGVMGTAAKQFSTPSGQ